jgi:heptosyltransferase-2
LPAEFGEQVVEKLVKANRKVIVFGKDGKSQGLVNFKFDKEKVYDFREIFSIKQSLAMIDKSMLLLSNDSAPIHLAGATDIWIVGIFTAKHPNFVIPFRNGSQNYKTVAIENRPACWPCNVDAVTTCRDEIRADYCTNLENMFSCFPTAEKAFQEIEKIIEYF